MTPQTLPPNSIGVSTAQHTFDLFHSVRFETVINGIEAFTSWLLSHEHARSPRCVADSESSAPRKGAPAITAA